MATHALPLAKIARSKKRAGKQSISSPPAKSSPWILDRWRDLLLFVGTPVLLIPIFTAAQARWSAQDIFLFVGAFGAMGHHLPGMIRAYGDRALFARFKTRFIVAPVLLLIVCIWSSFYNIQAVQLVALAWGIWHGMMQTYGFCRIYDAKASAKAASRARIDLALCFAWFVGAVLLSPMRFRSSLDLYYESGGPVIPVGFIVGLRSVILIALGLVTAVFLWRQWSDWRGGRGASSVKMVLLVSSIGFWWYCNNGVQNILVGIALFEVFHDVQYLAIVWIYNRARVERDQSIHGFMRFVFRRSGALIGVYVGLVLAYGSIAFTTSAASAEWMRHALIGVVTASALLHFYYDGFIWKVRETQTRAMLGIEGAGAAASLIPRRTLPVWAGHGLRWAALVVPFGALCAAQLVGRVVPAIERTEKVAQILPHDPQAQLNYGKALHEAGRVEEAISKYEFALSLNPSLAEAEFYLGAVWKSMAESKLLEGASLAEASAELDRAMEHYERSLLLDPKMKNGKCETSLAGILVIKGLLPEARRRYEHSLSVNPDLQVAHKELADILCGTLEYDSAIAHYKEALRIQPDFKQAQQNLDFARTLVGR
ncbi:MAG TPA: tetratricopeptide repeat protein [Chthoniobacterales bacterium]|nr:tetratricopeptide repeat protein [Chthoniobacterales bacterium]